MSDFPDGTYPVNVRNAILNVNVTNSTLDVNVTNSSLNVVVESGSIDANITNSSLNVVVQSGSIDANITNASLDVNVTNSVLNVSVQGQASVSIDNANVYLNVKNENFLENRITLENKGSDPAGFAAAGLQGKFFPQGCRGIIKIICVYARNTYTTDATIRIHIAIRPGAPAFASYTATVPAGSEGWVYVYPHLSWEYNSIFIYWERVSGNPQVAYDTDTPYDAYFFNGTAEQWQCENRRYWFKIDITGRTSGDIPVSGTVNTINIPNKAAGASGADVNVPGLTEVSLLTVEGMGTVHYVRVMTNLGYMNFNFYVDGELIAYGGLGYTLRVDDLYNFDPNQASEKVKWLLHDTSGLRFVAEWCIPLQFKRSFEIRAYNPDANTNNARVLYCVYDLIS